MATVDMIDMDGDSDLDILTQYAPIDGVTQRPAWYENVDGRGAFSGPRVLPGDVSESGACAVDIDGDGDVDVVATQSYIDSRVAVYNNTDGLGTFGQQHVIGRSSSVRSVSTSDFNQDGREDILVGGFGYYGGFVTWFENRSEVLGNK